MAEELVIITADWKLEQAGGRTYGMAYVEISPPYQDGSIKRGFSLHSPTHQRCALFSLVLALEHVDTIRTDSKIVDYAVCTKHRRVHDVLTDGSVDKWEARGKWPPAFVHQRAMYLRARDLMRELAPRGVNVLYIQRDEGDAPEVDLYPKEESETGGVDLEKTMRDGGKEGVEKAMRGMRMRGVMAQELVSSGARASRKKKL